MMGRCAPIELMLGLRGQDAAERLLARYLTGLCRLFGVLSGKWTCLCFMLNVSALFLCRRLRDFILKSPVALLLS